MYDTYTKDQFRSDNFRPNSNFDPKKKYNQCNKGKDTYKKIYQRRFFFMYDTYVNYRDQISLEISNQGVPKSIISVIEEWKMPKKRYTKEDFFMHDTCENQRSNYFG